MPQLSDTQLVILSAACAREDRLVLPLPRSLKGGAAAKVIGSLIAKGLIEEIEANVVAGDPVWRDTDDGRRVTLVATPSADAVLDGGAAEAAPLAPQQADSARKARAAAKPRSAVPKPRKAAAAPPTAKTRGETKQARLIAMLKRGKEASIAEIAEAFGWQHHTVRGAIAGGLKKKLGLAIVSEPHEARGRIYRISE